MISHALQRFRNETNREVQQLGTHIRRLESEMPDLERYQFNTINSGMVPMNSDPDMFKAAPGGPGGPNGIEIAFSKMTDLLGNIQGLGTGINDVYKPPPNPYARNGYGSIIKGGDPNQRSWKLFWSQDDRRMWWGLLPIWTGGAYKYVLELVTLFFVLVSVVVIILQSYERFDPDRCAKSAGALPTNQNILDAIYAHDAGEPILAATADGSGRTEEKCVVEAESELFLLQALLVAWFTAEYIVRWTAVRPDWAVRRPYTWKQFWGAKLRYTFSFMPLIDLVSILPFYITLNQSLAEIDSDAEDSKDSKGHFLLVLRVVRIMRIFKLSRNNRTLTDVVAALQVIISDLIVFFVVILTLVVLISTTMYYVEKGNPEGWFTSIPECMYWTIITFTSVGYGDRHPVSDGGRMVAAVASLVGTIMMNFPIALIILSFDEVYKIRKGREERASMVVDQLFSWSGRHRGKQAIINAPSSIKSQHPLNKKTSTLRKLLRVGRSNRVRPAGARSKKNQKMAKKRLLDMILQPHIEHIRIGNAAYSGRDHYLVSKYATKWHLATENGRAEREAQHLEMLRQGRKDLGLSNTPRPASPPSTDKSSGIFAKGPPVSSPTKVKSTPKIIPVSRKISMQEAFDDMDDVKL